MEQEKPQRRIVGDPSAVPNIYTNSTQISVTANDVVLHMFHEGFDLTQEMAERRLAGVVHMSHPHAWTLAHLILRTLTQAVKDHGLFLVYPNVLENLGLKEPYDQLKELANGSE